jgi:transposase
MGGIYKLEINESSEELKELLRKQKVAAAKERIQLLYLLKTRQVLTIQEVAKVLGRNRVTVQDWLKKYREGGLSSLLNFSKSTGRPPVVPKYVVNALLKRLEEPEGFNSYKEIGQWLKEKFALEVNYKTLHKLVHYKLKASPKIAKPQSNEQKEEKVLGFKKN